MTIEFLRRGESLGSFAEEIVPSFVDSGAIQQTDHYWHEGMEEWQLVGTRWPRIESGAPPHFSPTNANPSEASSVAVSGTVQTNVKQGALFGGWACFGLGLLFLLGSGWFFVIYLPLFFASFVLSIVAMAQRRVLGGVLLLLSTLLLPPVAAVGLASAKMAKEKAEKMRSAQGGNLEPGEPASAPAEKLELVSWKWYQQRDFAIAEGEVKNVSAESLKYVAALVSFYTVDDKFVTSDKAIIGLNPILPGQISPFKVMADYNPAMEHAVITFQEINGGTIPWKKKE